MNEINFEKFRKTIIKEFKNLNYVESLEILVLLQEKTINKLHDEYLQK
jgi:hypothetical protein